MVIDFPIYDLFEDAEFFEEAMNVGFINEMKEQDEETEDLF